MALPVAAKLHRSHGRRAGDTEDPGKTWSIPGQPAIYSEKDCRDQSAQMEDWMVDERN